jgi:hypothetical protein
VTTFASVTAVAIPAGDVALGGEVWMPSGQVAAGVVMIGGSGPADRTNDGYFDAYRVALARHGVAGLRYDKRGVGPTRWSRFRTASPRTQLQRVRRQGR